MENWNIMRMIIGRIDAETDAPILWPLNLKSQLIGKDFYTGKVWGQVEKRVTDDEMVGWHHQLNAHQYEWTPGDSEGKGRLECCSAWVQSQIQLSNWATSKLPSFRDHLKKFISEKQFETTELGYYIIAKLL